MCQTDNIGLLLDRRKIERIEKIEEMTAGLMMTIDDNCPNGHEKKETKKYLTTALMWARAAITRHQR